MVQPLESYRNAMLVAQEELDKAGSQLRAWDEDQGNALLADIGGRMLASLDSPFSCAFRQTRCPRTVGSSPLTHEGRIALRRMRARIEPSRVEITLYREFLTFDETRFILHRMIMTLALIGLCVPNRAGTDLDLVWALTDFAEGGLAGFSSNAEDCFLMLDWPFLRTLGYASFRREVERANLPFAQRRHALVWRGAATGGATPSSRDSVSRPFAWQQRLDACAILSSGPHAQACDVGVTDARWIADARRLAGIEEAGLRKPRIEKIDFMKFRMALVIDGLSNSFAGLFQNLLMGCCVLKVGSPMNYRQWYYPRMSAWEHFVPVAADLGDLDDVVGRCLDGSVDIEGIARRGAEFARGLTFEAETNALTAQFDALMTDGNERKQRFATRARELFG